MSEEASTLLTSSREPRGDVENDPPSIVATESSGEHRVQPIRSHSLQRWWYLGIMLTVLIGARSLNYVLYVRLASIMQQYTWLLSSLIIPLTFTLVCWPVVWVKMYFTKDITPEMRSVRSWYFILCGVLDGFSVILATIPAPFVEGPVQVIVAQSVILFNMLFSYLYIGARYRWSHYLGTAFILTGVLIGSIPEFHGHENTKFYWILILLVATVPAALSNTAKELGLKEHDLDVWYFNAWVGTYQVVFGLLTIPLVFVPILCGRKDGPISPSEFPLYVAHGMQCFLGTSPEPEAGGVASHCRNAPPVFAFHLLLSVIFNMFLMLTLKYGSATLAMVASAVQVAFSVFAFQISFIAGKATRTVRPLDIVALVVLVMGLFVYQYRPEIRDRPSLTATRAVARMVHATPRGAADDFITGQQFVEAETNGLDGAKKQV